MAAQVLYMDGARSGRATIPHDAVMSAISMANSISESELLGLRAGWDGNVVPGHDFNIDGLRGWQLAWHQPPPVGDPSALYGIISVSGSLRIKYDDLDPGGLGNAITLENALIMRSNIRAMILEKPWNISPMNPVRVSLSALAVQNDGAGPVLVQPGVSYRTQAQGLIAATGPLSYDTALPHLVRGETWILAPATGELRLYSPTGDAGVRVREAYRIDAGEPGIVYMLDGTPVKVHGREPVKALHAMGGDATYPLGEDDGLYSSILPGNPLIVKVPSTGEGVLLLHLAPGAARAPTKLEAYTYQDGGWRMAWSTWIIPAQGRLAAPINPGPHGLVMLKSSQTVVLDRVSWAGRGQVEPVNPARLEALSYRLAEGDGYTVVEYRAGGGEVLVRVDAPTSLGEARVMAGAHLTIYGRLWITGQPPQAQGSWVVVWSDVTEIPPGARDVRVWLVAYQLGQEPDAPMLVAYVRPLLYPVIAAVGYPQSSYDVAHHTEAVVGINSIVPAFVNSLPVYFDVLAVRTSYPGSPWIPVPDIDGVRAAFGTAYGAPPCPSTPPSRYYLEDSPSTLSPNRQPAWAGVVDVAVFLSTLGSYTASVLAFTIGGPAGVYTAISLSAQSAQLVDAVLDAYYGGASWGSARGWLDACLRYNVTYYEVRYGWGDDYKSTFIKMNPYIKLDTSRHGVEHAVVILNNYNPTGLGDDDAAYILYQFYP